jgi:DNA-binding transcriptional ArsR family regulator
MEPSPQPLDTVFQALANPTRRAVVEKLVHGPAAVSELAQPFDMALPSFLQHLRVLEDCGLVRSSKSGRVRTVRVVPQQLRQASQWLERQRRIWEKRLDQFDAYVNDLEESP